MFSVKTMFRTRVIGSKETDLMVGGATSKTVMW